MAATASGVHAACAVVARVVSGFSRTSCSRLFSRIATTLTSAAATTLASMPIFVVPEMPMDGMSVKPASSEPTAAPTVFMA